MLDLITVAKIIGFHGIHGEVKLVYSERLVKNLEILDKIYLFKLKGDYEILDIEEFRVHKTNVLLKFKQYSSKTEIEDFKGAELKQKLELLAPLDNEEYFINDLIDLDVFDQDNNRLGKVRSIFSGKAANDMLEIRTKARKLKLIPFVEEIVPIVDIKNKKIIINNMPGLLDDEV